MTYYVVNNRKIVGFALPINLAMNVGFVPLTEEQTAFYEEHPTASVGEVLKGELIQTYTPPEESILSHAESVVSDLKAACYGSVTISSLEYSVAVACVNGTSLLFTGDRYYSVIEAKNIIKQFMNESNRALTIYNTYKTQIESAKTKEEINNLYSQAMEALNGEDNSNQTK